MKVKHQFSVLTANKIADPTSGAGVKNNDIGGKVKPRRESHVENTKHGMGSYYGAALRNPHGRMRGSSVGYVPATAEQLKTPPKALA